MALELYKKSPGAEVSSEKTSRGVKTHPAIYFKPLPPSLVNKLTPLLGEKGKYEKD